MAASSITTTQGFAQLQEARVAVLQTPIPEIETVQPELQAAFETGFTLDVAYRKVRVGVHALPFPATALRLAPALPLSGSRGTCAHARRGVRARR